MLVDAEPDLILGSSTEHVAEVPEVADSPLLAITRLLWNQRQRLKRPILASLIMATVIVLLIPNSYEATLQLMPPDNDAGSGMAMLAGLMGKVGMGSSGGGSSILSELLGTKNSGALFVGILRSRTVEDRIIDRFDLRKTYSRKTYEDTRKKLESRTDINEDRKTGLIKIVVADRDRTRAAALAQAYVDELDRLVGQVNTSSAHRERVFLEQRLAVVHKELQDASKDFSEFSSKNTTLDIKEQGKAMVESAAVLQGQLIAAESELSGLQQIYMSDNVRVRSLQARIGELKRQLDKMGGKDYTGSPSLESDSMYPSIRQLPIIGLQYAELYRRVRIEETVFEILTEQYELAKVQEAKETPSVKILDAPKPPEKKSWPPRILLIFVGGIFGFLLASSWIIGGEFWSEIDPNEPHKKFISKVISETRRPRSPHF
jgi:capsule polysaccharide export protein KpsE/RkpR